MIEYDPHQWRSHLFDIRGSMLREIFARVSLCVLWSVMVVAFNQWVSPIGIPSTVHSLVGIAVSMLIVFRTNSSYDRFWEGRRLWGSIVNDTRSLGRAAMVYLQQEPRLAASIVRWTEAFAYATMSHLRGKPSLGPLAAKLPADQVEYVTRANHLPLAVTRQISTELYAARKQGVITDYVMIEFERLLIRLTDHFGACERIHRTPLPYAYMVHLRRALILYCYSLPFALVDTYYWLTVFVALFVSYVFFGIEEIGVEIEDPFGEDENDLPLEKFCAGIERNLEGLLDEPD